MQQERSVLAQEVGWTATYAYFGSWVGGVLLLLPTAFDRQVWNFPFLFFMYLQVWGEVNPPATSNPASWVKNYVCDEITQKLPRRTPSSERLVLQRMALDVLGFALGIGAYVLTLGLLGQTSAVEQKLHPATYVDCNWLHAVFIEFLVTVGTQLAGPALEFTLGLDPSQRTSQLLSNVVGSFVFLEYGLESTGAYMNPASATGLFLVALLGRRRMASFGQVCTLLVVYVAAPLLGGVVSGVVEAGIEVSKRPAHTAPAEATNARKDD